MDYTRPYRLLHSIIGEALKSAEKKTAQLPKNVFKLPGAILPQEKSDVLRWYDGELSFKDLSPSKQKKLFTDMLRDQINTKIPPTDHVKSILAAIKDVEYERTGKYDKYDLFDDLEMGLSQDDYTKWSRSSPKKLVKPEE